MQSLWILAASFLFSLMAVFIKFGVEDFGTCELIFYRSILGAFVIFIFTVIKGYSLKTDHFISHMKRSCAGTVSMSLWFISLTMLSVGTSLTLSYTSPLFMGAFVTLMALLKRESVPWRLIGLIALGFSGIVIILQPSFAGDDQLLGAILALASAMLAVVAYWQIKELGQLKEPSWRIVFYFTLFGTFYGLFGCLLFEGGFSPVTFNNVGWIIGIALTATLAQCALTMAFGRGNVLLTSCLQFSAIIFAEIFAVVFFHESVSLMAMIGMAIIMVAGVSSTVITKKMEKHSTKS